MENSTTTVREGYIEPEGRKTYAVIRIEVVNDPGDPTKQNKYTKLVLRQKGKRHASAIKHTILDTMVSADYERDLISILGKLVAETPEEIAKLPEDMQEIPFAGNTDYVFPEPMYGVYTKEGTHIAVDANGIRREVPHKRGELVRASDGSLPVYYSEKIFMCYDDAKSNTPVDGFSFAEGVRSVLRRYRPVSTYTPERAPERAPAQTNANPALEAGAQPPLTAEQMNQNPIPPQGMGQMPQQGMAGTASVNF